MGRNTTFTDTSTGQSWQSKDYGDGEDRNSITSAYNAMMAASAEQARQKKAAEDLVKQHTALVNSLSADAKDFRGNLPGYIGGQADAAGDYSRSNLVNDIANIKQNSNSRGLLYSGINEGNQNQARAFEGANLGKNIQTINKQAHDQADYKDQIATSAQAGFDMQGVGMQSLQAQMKQNSYEQALQEQQNRSSFFKAMFTSAATMVGMAALL